MEIKAMGLVFTHGDQAFKVAEDVLRVCGVVQLPDSTHVRLSGSPEALGVDKVVATIDDIVFSAEAVKV